MTKTMSRSTLDKALSCVKLRTGTNNLVFILLTILRSKTFPLRRGLTGELEGRPIPLR